MRATDNRGHTVRAQLLADLLNAAYTAGQANWRNDPPVEMACLAKANAIRDELLSDEHELTNGDRT